ncbi:unnamed protein product [Paramecium octaurelia]|uniref:Uncharacterized protein n=1 Tax=Paramecium octaurelia TaxID=43137 RepID=A0A8S1TUU5_PAROT|nr:unnamed protein product [Paramecium octaurelia]
MKPLFEISQYHLKSKEMHSIMFKRLQNQIKTLNKRGDASPLVQKRKGVRGDFVI